MNPISSRRPATEEDIEALRQLNAVQTESMERVPFAAQHRNAPPGLISVFRSKRYLAQLFATLHEGVLRLSVNRSTMQVGATRWDDGLTWDELQQIKRECGYGDCDAVEVYPSDGDIVNDANMRHLFIYESASCPFVWRSGEESKSE